jgi:hypothetical protein
MLAVLKQADDSIVCSRADSDLDGVRTWDSDSLKKTPAQPAYEMTPRDTANSTVRAAGGDAADYGQMHTRSKRRCNAVSESQFVKVRLSVAFEYDGINAPVYALACQYGSPARF